MTHLKHQKNMNVDITWAAHWHWRWLPNRNNFADRWSIPARLVDAQTVVTTTIRLRFQCNSTTTLRPFYGDVVWDRRS